jgi:acetyl esterase/lipase
VRTIWRSLLNVLLMCFRWDRLLLIMSKDVLECLIGHSTWKYRLSSATPLKAENFFPAALIDALTGYRYLVKTLGFKATNIVVSGDSAGGRLAFALVRYLTQEAIPSLLPPGAAVLLSPTVDWACTHDANPGSSVTRNTRSDIVQVILQSGYTARVLCGSLPEDIATTNSWISPSSLHIDTRGLFINFPRAFVLVGGAEQTLDPIKTLLIGCRLTMMQIVSDMQNTPRRRTTLS